MNIKRIKAAPNVKYEIKTSDVVERDGDNLIIIQADGTQIIIEGFYIIQSDADLVPEEAANSDENVNQDDADLVPEKATGETKPVSAKYESSASHLIEPANVPDMFQQEGEPQRLEPLHYEYSVKMDTLEYSPTAYAVAEYWDNGSSAATEIEHPITPDNGGNTPTTPGEEGGRAPQEPIITPATPGEEEGAPQEPIITPATPGLDKIEEGGVEPIITPAEIITWPDPDSDKTEEEGSGDGTVSPEPDIAPASTGLTGKFTDGQDIKVSDSDIIDGIGVKYGTFVISGLTSVPKFGWTNAFNEMSTFSIIGYDSTNTVVYKFDWAPHVDNVKYVSKNIIPI